MILNPECSLGLSEVLVLKVMCLVRQKNIQTIACQKKKIESNADGILLCESP